MKRLEVNVCQKMKKMVVLLLCLCLFLSGLPISEVQASDKNNEYIEEVSSEEEYFLPIIVEENCVTQGDEEVDYIVEEDSLFVNIENITCDTIDSEVISEMDVKVVGDTQYVELEEISEECNIEVVEEEDRTVYVKPFQTKSLIVEAEGKLPKVDATDIIKDGNNYILEFATEEETQEAYEVLGDSPNVTSVVGENVYHTFSLTEDDFWSEDHLSWGADYINSPHAISYAETLGEREEVVVAIIDTGIDRDHPYLKERIHPDSSEMNFYSYEDFNGHGTHVAGIVAANTPSNVSIMVISGLNTDGYGSDLTLANCIYYAMNSGADIINMSWGGYEYWTEDVLKKAVKTAHEAGVTLVAAAGNESSDASYFFPAASPYCITVGASKKDGSNATFSNYGSAVDISAPGEGIFSTYLNGGYAMLSGTSMSAPFVAAACAMEQTFYGKKTPNEMKTAIKSHVTPFTDGCVIQGRGIIDFTPYIKDVMSVQSVLFNYASGYYEEELEVTLSCATEGAQIYYTIDKINGREGANPGPEKGTLYTAPIKVTENTVIRAAAFREDLFPSKVTKAVYRYDDCDSEDAYVVDDTGTLTAYLGFQTKIEIPDKVGEVTVKRIGRDVFRESLVEEIILPDTVTEIGEGAFYKAIYLEKIHADGVLSLGEKCFYSAYSLKTVEMKSVETIGVYCFAYTEELTKLEMNQLTVIPEKAFYKSQIKNLTANKVLKVGERAFFKCYNLYKVSLEGVQEIEKEAFYDSTLTQISMPNVERIGESAFYQNDSLRALASEKLERIGKNAFKNCESLRQVDLPSVKRIGATAFNKCKLTSLNMPEVEWADLSGCKLGDEITEISYPNAIYFACSSAPGVETVYLPKCISLSGINNSDKLTSVYAPNAIEVFGLSNCAKLKELCFPLAQRYIATNYAESDAILSLLYIPNAKEVTLADFYALDYGILSECTELELAPGQGWKAELYTPNVENLQIKGAIGEDYVEVLEGDIIAPRLKTLSFRWDYVSMALPMRVQTITDATSATVLDRFENPLVLYSNNPAIWFDNGATNYVRVQPPTLKEDLPKDFTVTSENFVLQVKAYCADASYKWYYSSDGKNYKTIEGNNRSKLIPWKKGYYYCKVTDNESKNYIETEKCKVTLNVQMRKLQFNFEQVTILLDEVLFPDVGAEAIWVPDGTSARMFYNGDFREINLNNKTVIETDGVDFGFRVTEDTSIQSERKKILRENQIEILGMYALEDGISYRVITNAIYEGKTLKEAKDYEVSAVADGTNLYYVVRGMGEYAGVISGIKKLTVPKLSECQIVQVEDCVYTGNAQMPEIEIVYQGEILPKEFYTCEYRENIEPGTAKVTIEGGDYLTGKAEVSFDIYIPMSDVTLTYEKELLYREGYDVWPKYSVSHEQYKVTYKSETSNNINVGVARTRLTGTGMFRGVLEFEYNIVPMDLKNKEEQIYLDKDVYVYTGLPIEPKIKCIGGNLQEGRDYTVSYENNVETGMATAIICGTGNYTGTASVAFSIVPIELGSLADRIHICKQEFYTYTGLPIEIEIEAEGLTEGNDYIVSYENNVNPGLATVKIMSGETNQLIRGTTFEIKKSILNKQYFKMERDTYYGTVKSIAPKVLCEQYQQGKDFEVQFSQDKNTKKGIATITGIGGYEGQVILTYKLIPMEEVVVTGVISKSSHHKKISLSWNAIAGATGYQIYDVEKKKIVKTVSANSTTISGLKVSSIHTYKVRAYLKVDGKKHYGKYSSVTICKTAPKPTHISSYGMRHNEYRIYCGEFGMVKGASGVELVISNSRDFKGSVLVRKNIKKKYTRTVLKKLKKGTYYVKARTYNTYVNENGKKMKSYSKYTSIRRIKLRKNV